MNRVLLALTTIALVSWNWSASCETESRTEISDNELETLAREVSSEVQEASVSTQSQGAEPVSSDVNEKLTLPENQIPVLVGSPSKAVPAKDPVERLILSMIVVVVVGLGIFVVARYWRRSNPGLKPHQQIKIISQFALGPRKSLAIVRVAGESVLIGVTDQNISMIKSLALLDEDVPEEVPESFADEILRDELRRQEPEDSFFVGKLKNLRPS